MLIKTDNTEFMNRELIEILHVEMTVLNQASSVKWAGMTEVDISIIPKNHFRFCKHRRVVHFIKILWS